MNVCLLLVSGECVAKEKKNVIDINNVIVVVDFTSSSISGITITTLQLIIMISTSTIIITAPLPLSFITAHAPPLLHHHYSSPTWTATINTALYNGLPPLPSASPLYYYQYSITVFPITIFKH